MIHLLIARHGNTFDPGDVILRVGCGTDLPLSNSGKLQAKALGEYLHQHHPDIAAVYTSTLQRTISTAEIILKTMGSHASIHPLAIFDEIDYGPDEGKPESAVVARIGEAALADWENHNCVPPGWQVDPEKITDVWRQFATQLEQNNPNQTILVVTSNGTARFAPEHAIKLKTGAVSSLRIDQGQWQCLSANQRPAQ